VGESVRQGRQHAALRSVSAARYRLEIQLTLEQRFQLRQFWLEAESMNRGELLRALISEREELLLQQRYYVAMLEMAGVDIEPAADVCFELPGDEEGLVAVFGHTPSDQELSDYCNERILRAQEAARMDVDIEAIALGFDEE
jgi:hypothetical protein